MRVKIQYDSKSEMYTGLVKINGQTLEISSRRSSKFACKNSAKLLRKLADKFDAHCEEGE